MALKAWQERLKLLKKLPAPAANDLFSSFDSGDAANTEVAVAAQQREVAYHCIQTQAQLDEWLAKIHAAELTAIDTETDSLNALQAQRSASP